jgi:cytochrome c6
MKLTHLLFFFLFLDEGKILFNNNCSMCHPLGKNVILPEKNLTKDSLQANGMNSVGAIIYQLRNGKNGMPAFGDRLTKEEMKKLAEYILFESEKNFEN